MIPTYSILVTVPDPFQCLFQAIGTVFQPSDACNAMFRYSLVRQIAQALVGTFDWNVISAFLVTLTTFERTVNLSGRQNSLWGMLLDHEPAQPSNNWSEL
jgi:hypothetical protein